MIRDVEWWSWEVVCDAPAEVHFSRLRDARRVLVPGASVGQSLVGTVLRYPLFSSLHQLTFPSHSRPSTKYIISCYCILSGFEYTSILHTTHRDRHGSAVRSSLRSVAHDGVLLSFINVGHQPRSSSLTSPSHRDLRVVANLYIQLAFTHLGVSSTRHPFSFHGSDLNKLCPSHCNRERGFMRSALLHDVRRFQRWQVSRDFHSSNGARSLLLCHILCLYLCAQQQSRCQKPKRNQPERYEQARGDGTQLQSETIRSKWCRECLPCRIQCENHVTLWSATGTAIRTLKRLHLHIMRVILCCSA